MLKRLMVLLTAYEEQEILTPLDARSTWLEGSVRD
jgi:hypothetical protein